MIQQQEVTGQAWRKKRRSVLKCVLLIDWASVISAVCVCVPTYHTGGPNTHPGGSSNSNRHPAVVVLPSVGVLH